MKSRIHLLLMTLLFATSGAFAVSDEGAETPQAGQSQEEEGC